jgi:uncharacterized membrane protein
LSTFDWLNLLVRWTHLIAGIAWIGSSFYFIWLDAHLERAATPDPAVEGTLWMVHSGGFYRVERRRIGPGQMPALLHWFKWEAAITWMSGLALLAIVYYLTGGIYLIDPAVSRLTPLQAAGAGLGAIAVAWFAYDALWQSALARRPAVATTLTLVLIAAVTLLFCRLLGGRAAFIHVGGTLGTIMVANVWVRILPSQQRMIDATAAGRTPDFSESDRAKTRSVHNSYLTFPVLFIMLSNHFPATYAAPLNAVVLALLMVAGAAARHVMIGKGPSRRWAYVPVIAAFAGVFLLTRPAAGLIGGWPAPTTPGPAPAFAEVQTIVQTRCGTCHSRTPSAAGFASAPAGVMFDDPASIRRLSMRIYERAVVTKTMPLANMTGITEAERAVLARWVEHGAPAH